MGAKAPPGITAIQAQTMSSGIGDVGVDNTLHIWCGDSTTEGMQAAGGGADTFKAFRQAGGALEKVVGMINFGGSGYTLNSFISDAATPGFTGPSLGAEVGILQWDSWMHKPTGAISLATALAWRAQYPQYRTFWSICYGINDLILYAANGNLSQQGIVDYLVPKLRQAVQTIKVAYPQDSIILRIPNPMTYAPYNAQFPSSAAYPTFDTDPAATSQALVEKWNQALRQTYLTVRGEFSRCVLIDTWDTVFGKSYTTLTAATQQPYLGDRVHPGPLGYAAIALQYIRTVTKYNLITPRLDESERRAALLGNNPWDNYPTYFVDNPKYKRVVDSILASDIGSNYIDILIPYTTWLQTVSGPIYVVVDGVASQYFATYAASAFAANTRLLSVSPSAALQGGKAKYRVEVYQDNGIALLARDAYVHSQAATAKEAFAGAISGAGNGYIRFTLSNANGRMSSKFLSGALFGKLAVGGAIQTVLDFTAGGWTVNQHGTDANRIIQFNKAGTDYASYADAAAALFFSDSYPSPKAYEDVVISGTTDASAGTQSAHAHGLGYTPKRVQILPKGAGTVYQSAPPDGTNIYVKATANSIAFDAYVK